MPRWGSGGLFSHAGTSSAPTLPERARLAAEPGASSSSSGCLAAAARLLLGVFFLGVVRSSACLAAGETAAFVARNTFVSSGDRSLSAKQKSRCVRTR